MVSVNTLFPHGASPDEKKIDDWLRSLVPALATKDLAKLRDASNLLLEIHHDDASDIIQAYAVAEILAEMGLDGDTLVVAMLHGALPGSDITIEECQGRFGPGVAQMLSDMIKIGVLTLPRSGDRKQSESEHTENLRRLLLSMADDIRVVLIVLAERLHLMRIIKNLPEPIRCREAMETREIYAPLANRLGIWQIKWELEDLSLRYLEPESYINIARRLDGRRNEREHFINEVIALLQEKFHDQGIRANIFGRPKHIYSIWKKMSRKSVDIDQIFDLRAVRVLVDTVADCYAALGVVHALWRHIPGEFDDYIATPKTNMYRSIHTAVIGPGEKTLEVQIRTSEMHYHAELGVAAHWRYKERGKEDIEFERRIALMRGWLELKSDASESFVDSLKTEFEANQVYVLTPQGKVIELPKGSTPLDFAYAIHTDVGHRCRGARIDGRITQLTQELESGQTVEIITAKEGGPSRDWISPHLGYLKTNKARNRVRHWFKNRDYAEHLALGRANIEREIERLGVGRPNLARAVKRFNFKKVDDLLAAVGRGEISPIQVAGMGERLSPPKERATAKTTARINKQAAKSGRSEVVIQGVENLLTHLARCCKPVPSDDIVGFITRGRGVTVHRRDCSVIIRMEQSEEERGRLIDVIWADQAAGATYPVDIRIEAADRKGLLRDLSAIFTNEEIDVTGVKTLSHRKTDLATMTFTIEIADILQLSRILEKLSQLPDVLNIRRQT